MYSCLDNLCEELLIKYYIDEPMAKHTSFKVGGNADRFVELCNKEQALKVLELLKQENIPYFVLGNGSNLLVSDKGIRSVVLVLRGDFLKIELIKPNIIRCGAGVMLSSLCIFAKNNSLTGLEFAYGIPGTVGGAVYMNAGAYGGEIKDVVTQSKHLDIENLDSIVSLSNQELDFSYRHSFYSGKNCIISEALLELKQGEILEIAKKMDETLKARKDKQPLEYPSAGSTFKRPTGYFAGALIEQCGLKGVSVGGAMVSQKHSGFVINYKNATCEDILKLIELVKLKVKTQTNIELECEIKMIGEA